MAQEIADSKLIDTWASSGLIVEPDISKIIEGWQLGEQPPHEYMNWLQNTFGSKLNHILKNGVASWNNETEYLAGSSVQHNGNVWLCKTTNTNSEPTDVNANWKRIITVESLTTIPHNNLTNRDATGSHPISAITNLQTTLDNKVPKVASTLTAATRFSSTDGNIIDSLVLIDNAGSINSPGGLSTGGHIVSEGKIESKGEGVVCYGPTFGVRSSDYEGNYVMILREKALNTKAVYEHYSTVNGVRSRILATGDYQSATNVYGSTSDIKLKENIVDTTPKLEKLMQVKVRNFNYKGEDQKQIGVVAQEIEELFPSIVFETKDTKQVEKTDKDGNKTLEMVETGETTKNVKYSIIYMMMLKAMQEQQQIIEDLKARIEAIENNTSFEDYKAMINE